MQGLIGLLTRSWNSPTSVTLMSLVSRSLFLVAVLPFILKKFLPEDTSLFLLFNAIVGLQVLLDFGFSPTFSRVIGYAFAGVESLKPTALSAERNENTKANFKLMKSIFGTVSKIYLFGSLVLFFLLVILGTYSLFSSVENSSSPTENWIAWIIIILGTTIYFFGNRYSLLLLGINKVVLIKRWETLFNSLNAISSLIAVLIFENILALVIVNQVWLILTVARNYYLCKRSIEFDWVSINHYSFEREVFSAVFNKSLKSGVGIFFSYGVVQLSAVIYANYGSAELVASYLLALRVMNLISEVSRAPFYSKIPFLNILIGKNDMVSFVATSIKAMRFSLFLFAGISIIAGITIPFLLQLIDSQTSFVSELFWSLLCLGVFAERYGALHIQMLSCSNKIIWHISNGISGSIFIFSSWIGFGYLGIYSFATAYLIANFGFYAWYNALHSYRAFKFSFLQFERNVSLMPLSMLCGYLILVTFIY